MATTRLGIAQDADLVPDLAEVTDFADKVDAEIGTPVITSGTRPASGNFDGRRRLESDTGNEIVREGSDWVHPSIPYIANYATAGGPGLLGYSGLIALANDDNLVVKHNGTSYVEIMGHGVDGTNAAARECRYVQGPADAQSIPDAVLTTLRFPTARYTTSDVTPSGTGNTSFTVNRAGIWHISCGWRQLGASGGNGERLLSLTVNGVTVTPARDQNTTAPTNLLCTTTMRLAAGAVVSTTVYQDSSGAVNTWVAAGWDYNFMALAWLRP